MKYKLRKKNQIVSALGEWSVDKLPIEYFEKHKYQTVACMLYWLMYDVCMLICFIWYKCFMNKLDGIPNMVQIIHSKKEEELIGYCYVALISC